jgi:geranylgeranyl reductase
VVEKWIEKGVLHFKGNLVEVELEGELGIVERGRFDRLLRELAAEEGVKPIPGRVVKGGREKGRFWVEVRRGEERERVEGDVLVGADGVHSTIRKLFLSQKVPAVMTYFQTTPLPLRFAHFHFDREVGGDYYGWAFPHREGGHIGSTTPQLLQNLSRIYPSPSPVKGFPIPLWDPSLPMEKDGVFFVGDAAGQVLPTTFEGIYYAMVSGQILAEALLSGGSYSRLWNRRLGRRFKFFKTLEKGVTGSLRFPLLSLFKLKLYRQFVVNFWKRSS